MLLLLAAMGTKCVLWTFFLIGFLSCSTHIHGKLWYHKFSLSVVVAAQVEDYEGNVHLVFDGSNQYEGVLQVILS